MIELRMAKGARPTGLLLLELLQERGMEVGTQVANPEAIVSYGVTVDGATVPVLNANAGRYSKLGELIKLQATGILVPPFSEDGHNLTFPLLGRRLKHSKGKDIVPVLQNGVWLDRLRNNQVCDFFTQFIAKDREFRVYAYRRRILAVYEKVLRYPHRDRGLNIVWNWDSGYAFDFCKDAPNDVKAIGALAVQTMALDFGAVDIIQGHDSKFYTLEVNSAPGVQDRRQGVTALADKIAKWKALGFPKRNGHEEGPRAV